MMMFKEESFVEVMRKKARWRLTYGLGLLLKCAELVLAQCNDGQPQQINTAEPSQVLKQWVVHNDIV